jgi:hypothetical protein
MSLASQLAMNRQSWQALQENGVTDETELRLDFFDVAPGEQQANALASYLQAETDYGVSVGSRARGLLRKTSWMVNRATQKTQVSLDILDVEHLQDLACCDRRAATGITTRTRGAVAPAAG